MGDRYAHMAPKRLVIRSNPAPDESLVGYLQRASSINGYDNLMWIFEKHISDLEQIFTDENIQQAASVTGCDHEDLRYRSYTSISGKPDFINFFGTEIHRKGLSLKLPKVCPECLYERSTLRAVWDLVDWVACPIHEANLINRCPLCGRSLSWFRSSNKCGCGFFDYDDCWLKKAHGNEILCSLHISYLLGYRLDTPASLPLTPPIRALCLNDFLDTLYSLYTIPVRVSPSSPTFIQMAPIFSNSNLCVQYAIGIMMNWPDYFYQHVGNFSSIISTYAHSKRNSNYNKYFLIRTFLARMKDLAVMIDGNQKNWDKNWGIIIQEADSDEWLIDP